LTSYKMAAKVSVSVSDLVSGSKQLSTVSESKGTSKADGSEIDQAAVNTFKSIFEKHNGDLDAM
jgi:hypothetical protein